MKTKYDFDIAAEPININTTRMIKQIYKLIPLWEESGDWKKQLDTIIIEVVGLQEIFLHDANFVQLLAKLEGLRQMDLPFHTYRKAVFESITLLQGCRYE